MTPCRPIRQGFREYYLANGAGIDLVGVAPRGVGRHHNIL
jgi:hypothetical protein